MKKNNNNICRMTLLALPLLMLSACSQDDTLTAEQTITLTTPVIELSGVQASSRAESSLANVASGAQIVLYLHDSNKREYDREGNFYDSDFSDGISWTAEPSVTVTGGEGYYRAGIYANISLKATAADMPEIGGAIYAYRGSINVGADGSFIPDGFLQPHSAAVLLNLKDADGNAIDPNGTDATSNKKNINVYVIEPVGLAMMSGFVPTDADRNVDRENGQYFPNGTVADPVRDASSWPSYKLASYALGNHTPGTYPATWENGVLVTSTTPSNAWPLFEVTYCKDGFNGSTPLGSATTWTVNYPAKQLTLDAGKLYTFTATLGADAHITLDAGAVSISDWEDGSIINVGR